MESDYQYKTDFVNGIHMDSKGQYIFNFDKHFTNVDNGNICSARGKIYSYEDRSSNFLITCIGPTVCYLNGKLVYESNPNDEGKRNVSVIPVSLKKGYNVFKFNTEKTPLGFGFTFGNSMPQWEPYLFSAVEEENCGQLGFKFTEPYKGNVNNDNENIYKYPKLSDKVEDIYNPSPSVCLSNDIKGFVYAKAKLCTVEDTILNIDNDNRISLNGNSFVNAKELYLKKGNHTIIIEFRDNKKFSIDSKKIQIQSLVRINGHDAKWMYVGPFCNKIDCPEELIAMNKIYTDNDEKHYWKVYDENIIIRPCVETELYGRFTYPMGVTLYGILECGKHLGVQRYIDYVTSGVTQISKYHEYALFDKKRLGFPSLNQQISWLKELDDCGSFGSLMIESLKHKKIEEVLPIVKNIADFMMCTQERQDDGAFSRGNNTMWIDDMYMSIPFLSRYYELTKDEKYVDEAINQMLLYKEYFYIEKTKLMSHIYDVRLKKANEIPWCRGNGWVIFSISELMRVLPKNHNRREELVNFFNEMAEGLLDVQGKNGMWHQILDDSETYFESSSTAMFICAFSRSIQEEYCEEKLKVPLLNSIEKAWNGLIFDAIDDMGNLYGVCRGSGCSFSRDYYKKLSWRYNDAHGIGIVLLAGVEKSRVLKYNKLL